MPSQQEIVQKFKRIGIVGSGNMGSMMAFAFSELGLDVSIWDVKHENVDQLLESSKHTNFKNGGRIEGFYDIGKFTKSLEGQGERKIFLFSITHGDPADSVLKTIKGDLQKGDIILDGGNENYRRTERRQKECQEIGVSWIGLGVSGGYQSARRGPSLSPGGDKEALDLVMPLLELYSAKDSKTGLPCVTRIGPGGSGHFVKMVHNGIEGGMLSAVAEAWSILYYGREIGYEEIADIFAEWNSKGELRNNFLLEIGADLLRVKKTTKGDGKGQGVGDNGYVLDDVLDKVVQDDDNTEGTPYWSIMESAARHVSAPTLATAHYMRISSGNRAERLEVAKKLKIPTPAPIRGMKNFEAFREQLRRAVYASFLASFCQGLEMIARASEDEGWDIDLGKCLQIWRAGCIIRSEGIADILQPILSNNKELTNMKYIDKVAAELQRTYSSLKEITIAAIDSDHYLPAISATLEYVKYEAGLTLPTKFMEAQMDFFGAHGYNLPGVPGEDPGPVGKGAHHYEWRPAE